MLFFIPLFFVVLWGCLEVGFVGSKKKILLVAITVSKKRNSKVRCAFSRLGEVKKAFTDLFWA